MLLLLLLKENLEYVSEEEVKEDAEGFELLLEKELVKESFDVKEVEDFELLLSDDVDDELEKSFEEWIEKSLKLKPSEYEVKDFESRPGGEVEKSLEDEEYFW